jgi:hypothetical protein
VKKNFLGRRMTLGRIFWEEVFLDSGSESFSGILGLRVFLGFLDSESFSGILKRVFLGFSEFFWDSQSFSGILEFFWCSS